MRTTYDSPFGESVKAITKIETERYELLDTAKTLLVIIDLQHFEGDCPTCKKKIKKARQIVKRLETK